MNHWPLAAAPRHARMRWASTSVVVLFLLAGCKASVDIPDVVRIPEIVGEIVTRKPAADEQPSERRFVYDLVAGDVVVIDLNADVNIQGGHEPQEGDLLLYGTEPDGPWFWSGPLLDDPRTGGQCAEIMAPARDEAEAIAFEIGLRLPKADDFDPFEVTDGQFTDPTKGFCLNERGEVTRYRS